jgi:hypothetical protein
LAEKVIASLPTCPIPEVARLGRTLRAWRSQVLAYFDTDGLSNGGTEAIHMIIEKARRLAHGYRNFENNRLRRLLAANGTRGRRFTRGPRSSQKSQFDGYWELPLSGLLGQRGASVQVLELDPAG